MRVFSARGTTGAFAVLRRLAAGRDLHRAKRFHTAPHQQLTVRGLAYVKAIKQHQCLIGLGSGHMRLARIGRSSEHQLRIQSPAAGNSSLQPWLRLRLHFLFQPLEEVRMRSAANIFEEIKELYTQHCIRDFYVVDDIFNVNLSRL